jgi:isoquinoline 1-oxidoreductase alpha subunit
VITIEVNGTSRKINIEPDTPLLWVLRDVIGLTGTKFGCGIAQCGACTVHIDGSPMRSCSVPIGALDGAKITTIEGLSPDNSHPVQRAWIAEDVPQCGYCQSGQIMAAVAFLKEFPNPTDTDIDANITNICRCGTSAPRHSSRRRHDESLGEEAAMHGSHVGFDAKGFGPYTPALSPLP